jgi:hypothetical protein
VAPISGPFEESGGKKIPSPAHAIDEPFQEGWTAPRSQEYRRFTGIGLVQLLLRRRHHVTVGFKVHPDDGPIGDSIPTADVL